MNTTPSSTPHLTSTTASDRPRSDQDQPQVDATRRVRAAGERALVLGGGGSTGNAWLIGVIAGLFDAGLDVTTADLTIGTSAGSTAAAQIAGATPTELLAAILAAAPQQRTGPVGSDRGRVPIRPVADHLERISKIIASAEDAADMRRRMGAAALDMDAASDGSWQTQWRATVAARLPSQRWPQRTVLITAVDAHTGEPVVFDRHSGVDLVDAVAASCASGLPYRIGDSRYIDGGYRRTENADLAAGYARVLVLSPLRRQNTATAGLGHASRDAGRRTPRTRQQSRDDLPGQQLRAHVRRQCDGSVAASARCSSRLRPRQSPCRAAHRVLALTPSHLPRPALRQGRRPSRTDRGSRSSARGRHPRSHRAVPTRPLPAGPDHHRHRPASPPSRVPVLARTARHRHPGWTPGLPRLRRPGRIHPGAHRGRNSRRARRRPSTRPEAGPAHGHDPREDSHGR